MSNDITYAFHDNPAAGDVTTVTDGIYGTYVQVVTSHNGALRLPTTANYCVRECVSNCTPQLWTVTFQDVAFGDCSPCAKRLGLLIRLRKNPLADIENFDDDRSTLTWSYGGVSQGTVTGANLAATFVADMKSTAFLGGNDLFGATITNAGAVVSISIPCPYKLDLILGIDPASLLTAELPVVVKVTEGLEDYLTREYLRIKYPPFAFQPLLGARPAPSDTWCQNVCVINIQGCVAACPANEVSSTLDPLGLSIATMPVKIELIVNRDAAGYAAFITALNSQITGCAMPTSTIGGYTVLGSDDGATGETTTGLLDLTPDSLPANAKFLVRTSLGVAVGPVQLDATPTIAELVAALTAAYPSGTFAVQGGAVRFTGTIAGPNGTAINLERVSVP